MSAPVLASCAGLGRGKVAMPQSSSSSPLAYLGKVAIAAVALGLLLHLGHNWYPPHTCSFDWASSWLAPWVGTPAVIAALALLLYPRAPMTAEAALKDAFNARDAAASTPCRPLCSFPVLDCLAETTETTAEDAAQSSSGGLLKRLTRKLGSCRLFAVRFGKHAPMQAPHVDAPFFRRKAWTKSPRPSSENLRGGHWAAEHRSMGSRRHAQGFSRQDSGSVHGSTAQDVTSSHAEMSSAAHSSKGEWASSDAFAYTGHLAVDCLPYDTTEPMNEQVKEAVTELHLLQFGMMIGESSAELAIGMQGAAAPVGPGEDSLYGAVDCPEQFGRGWERIIEEHKEGLHYWVSRRHLRKGLFMYKSRTVYERASPDQMVSFTFADLDTRRTLWDDSATALEPLAAPSHPLAPAETVRAAAHTQSSFMYARTRFPPPMSQREYVYARRIWYKADDGGCYCINRAAQHPAPPEPGCRTTRVLDFSSGFVIRAVPGIYSCEPAVEVSTVYFEDSRAHSGILNMGIRKAMWPMTQKSEKGLRRYIAAHAVAGLPFRRSPPFECSPPPPPSASPEPLLDAALAQLLACLDPAPAAAAALLGGEIAAAAEAPPPLQDAEEQADAPAPVPPADAADMFSTGSVLRNAGMFGGYYPALTRGLQVTPILYAGYLGAWRYSALACKLLVCGCVASWQLLSAWHVRTMGWALGWVGRWATRSLGGRPGAGAAAAAGGAAEAKGLRSFPLHLSRGQPGAGAEAGGAGRPALRQRPSGQGRRLAQLATVAAKAVGMPLVHRLLSSGSRLGGARAQELRFAPAPAAAPAPRQACGSGASSDAPATPTVSRRVRPVVVDGVVVGERPPKQPRPQQPRPRARTLLQLMLGLQTTASDEARGEQQPQLRLRPLSRRIM